MAVAFESYELSEAGPVSVAYLRDGALWRTSRVPGQSLDDLPELPDQAREAILAAWTPEVVEAWSSRLSPVVEPEPPTVPASIPIWQFAWQAAAEGFITMKEARAWSGRGVLPSTLETKLGRVVTDPDKREGLAMRLESLTEVQRGDALIETLGALFGKDAPALDAFFVAASKRGETPA